RRRTGVSCRMLDLGVLSKFAVGASTAAALSTLLATPTTKDNKVAVAIAVVAVGGAVALVGKYVQDRVVPWFLLVKTYDSIAPESPPTPRSSECALFRHLPCLRSRVAWVSLGEFPTPIHTVTLPNVGGDGQHRTVYLKREDLSSPLYGGNKVRTLEHQIASCALHHDNNPDARYFVQGMSGSNQTVATVVHGRCHGLPIIPCLIDEDEPDFDNTLNLLSLLSFRLPDLHVWTSYTTTIAPLIQSAVFGSKDKVFAFGGNNLCGVLGQLGGMLELAEQIQRGDVPDVDVLYVAVGSGCTLTGQILGVCLARHLHMRAFQSPSFRIVAVPILPAMAEEHAKAAFYKSWWSRFHPLYPRYGFRRAAAFLSGCGLDVNLEPLATDFLLHHVDMITDPDIVGPCGAHSVASLEAATTFEASMAVEGELPPWMQSDACHASAVINDVNEVKPWLCGHFTAKVFAKLVADVRSGDDKAVRLMWQTKSWVQPRGDDDEWTKLNDLAATNDDVKSWVNGGLAHSALRPGRVQVPHGNSDAYRSVMTSISSREPKQL
ncbi:hypothetical protein H310_14538, partial [Aphanomyces invadans]